MITMTLHAVTVECETLAQALCILDEWARMGRIELPPAPPPNYAPKPEPAAAPSSFPRVKEHAKPTPRKAHLEAKKCGVCDDTFIPPNSRVVTCSLHRLKPGQNLAHERSLFVARKTESAPVAPPAAAPKPVVDKAAAKGLLGRAPIRPDEPTSACSACGDKARTSTLDKKGRCPDCQPVGGKS